jgi:arylsulfatase A-like enzyme
MIFDDNRLPQEVDTLAEVLSRAGYATFGIHDGGYLRADFGFDQGFDLYEDMRGKGLRDGVPAALKVVRNRPPDQPVFLFLHTYDTHTPYAPEEPYRSLFLDEIGPPTPGFEPTAEAMEDVRTSAWSDDPIVLPERDLAYARALYDAEIRYVDDMIARFLRELNETMPLEEIIIVVISDHGEEFGEHGSVLHEKLYTPVTRVPFIVVAPGYPGGVVRSEFVETVDLVPTLLDLVGVSAPSAVQGESLVMHLAGYSTPSRPAFSESPFFGGRRAVADGGYRLLLTQSSARYEVYDLGQDPFEMTDIAASVEEPDAVRLRNLIKEWQETVNEARFPQSGGETLSDEAAEQLRALGYID